MQRQRAATSQPGKVLLIRENSHIVVLRGFFRYFMRKFKMFTWHNGYNI